MNDDMRINRTQTLVLGFGLAAWLGLIGLVAAPYVFAGAVKLPAGDSRAAERAFLVAITALLGLFGVGVVRRWRWTFWLVLVARPSSPALCGSPRQRWSSLAWCLRVVRSGTC